MNCQLRYPVGVAHYGFYVSRIKICSRQPTACIKCKVLVKGKLGMHITLAESSFSEDGRKRQRFDTIFGESQDRHGKCRCLSEAAYTAKISEDILLDDNFYVESLGSVSAVLSSNCLGWYALAEEENAVTCCLGVTEDTDEPNQLAISQIYGVEASQPFDTSNIEQIPFEAFSAELLKEVHHFTVHGYVKCSSQRGIWAPKMYSFYHTNHSVCERWANQIQAQLDKDIKRPRNLMVMINPHSGRKNASRTWEEVSPLFRRAKINTMVINTERPQHAFDIVNSTDDDKLRNLDGILIVGGDGLFNEVLNGLLLRRHRPNLPMKPPYHEKSQSCSRSPLSSDSDLLALSSTEATDTESTFSSGLSRQSDCASSNLSAALKSYDSSLAMDYESISYKDGGFIIPSIADNNDVLPGKPSSFTFPNPSFRIGIIPAGSTDSIAVSTTGCRNALTSALHIILGEKMPLDVVRLVSWKSTKDSAEELPRVRYAASFAGYGFYGDVIKESEPNRWMGPARYDYAGTKVFFQHKLYDAEISFIEPPELDSGLMPGSSDPEDSLLCKRNGNHRVKRAACRLNCGICLNKTDFSGTDGTNGTSHSQCSQRWKHVKGSYISVGAAVISCRNDKAPNGVASTAHLADGLLHLILIKDCSRLSYLWHLIQLTREDADPLDFAFVEEHRTPQFHFKSHGEESVWNVDGELFPAHVLSAQVFRGLVNIFASGPDI
ncbi:hypothetical protein KP509_09G007200 [Ceratopteris richardii]|uniref:DAGKc domain-containing protein n=1 Tax=Ceratopteris richardii TaxID=49495 RepID=A0A8T2U487_CERRI|nr:hypothetical protein KP509_09G007200 [Ceratopteris richardii]